jgi:flagellin
LSIKNYPLLFIRKLSNDSCFKEAISLKVDGHNQIQNTDSMLNNNNILPSNTLQKISTKSISEPSTVEYSLKRNQLAEEIPPIEANVHISRITQNEISKIQTSDTVLNKIQATLQTGKELAIQANHKTTTDRLALQERLNHINLQIDQLNQTIPHTQVNAHPTTSANPDDADVIHSLKSDWFESAENLVADRYGLTGDGSVLGITLEESNPVYLAAIDYTPDDSGKSATEVLHINVKATVPATLPNGGLSPQYDDRVITHEMVHAIMGRNMNYVALPTWFKEGVAEFLPGADERIAANLANNGGGITGAKALQNDLGDGTDKSWKNDSSHYSAATMAVRYLHDNIKAHGHSGGIKDLLSDLTVHPTEELDQALSHVSSYKNVTDFVNEYVKKDAGAAYINKLDQAHAFSNADVGAIGGLDVDAGPTMTAGNVIPDIDHYSEAPLKHFKVEWPTQIGGPSGNVFNGQSASALAKYDSKTLGTHNADIINNPKGSADRFEKALSIVSRERARLGNVEKQLGYSLKQQNRMADAPTTRKNITIPNQSGTLLAAQAKKQQNRVLQLLRD